jgi:hypothetical protein
MLVRIFEFKIQMVGRLAEMALKVAYLKVAPTLVKGLENF